VYKKTSRLYGVNKYATGTRSHSCGATLFKIKTSKRRCHSLINSTHLGFSDYPMITEEAEFPLTQKPPCLIDNLSPTPSFIPGTQVKGFVIFKDNLCYHIENLCQ